MSSTPTTSKPSTSSSAKPKKRARLDQSDDEDNAKITKIACEALQTFSQQDAWDLVANSVAATGRELAFENATCKII